MVVVNAGGVVAVEDTCVADEVKVVCVIRDLIDPQANAIKHSMNLPGSMSVRVLLAEVCKQFGYMLNTISLHYEKQEGAETLELRMEQYKDMYLEDVLSLSVRRHNFTICELEGMSPQKMPPPPPPPPHSGSQASVTSDWDSGGLDKSSFFSNNTTLEPRPSYNNVSSTSVAYSSSDFTYSSALIKSDTGYVGLVNQAMTCYLNSLIQTLYMTPEFRNAIYKFHFDSGKGVKNIPYQLQRLFLLLQTSKKRAAETTDLTKSFGWDSSEVWHQHDVQELCRVMFDALEVSWRGTDQENLINHLYQGKMKDYVKCLECENESAREDTYLDIPLVIRPFGSQVTYKSIKESLDAFVQYETLQGRDQYFCEKCNKKCDAHKGLKFISFPYLLTLQMKRFDFDYNSMQRIKLNDKMSFPDTLNLNYLIEELNSKHNSKTGDSGLTVIDKSTSETPEQTNDDAIDEGIEVEASTSSLEDTALIKDVLKENLANENEVEGPYVYELFSIMIHSGSAAGGHYYAYIKCLEDGQWYSFNDQQVSKITYDDIRKTYGGSSTNRGYYSSSYASCANAYMLMYRQRDPTRNADFLAGADFPEHVKEELRRLNDKEEADRKQKELDKSTCKIKIFCLHPMWKKKLDLKMEIHKDKTLAEATQLAYKLFELDGVVEKENSRIVKYDDYQDSLECSFEDEDDTTMEKLLGGVKQSYGFDLLLQTKRPEQNFQLYKPGGVTVKLYVADMEKDIVLEPPVIAQAYLEQTIEQFKALVAQVLGVEDTNLCCVLERSLTDIKNLTVPNKTLKNEGFFKTNKVYVELNPTKEDNGVPFERRRFYSLLDRYQNTINILVYLPSADEVTEFQKQSYPCDRSPAGLDSAVESGVNSAEDSVDNGSEVCNYQLSSHASSERLAGRSSDLSSSDIDIEMQNLTLQSHLSQSDPNIFHSSGVDGGQSVSKGEILQSLQSRGSRSSLECQDSRSCSRSTQSTSPSAEFFYGNVNSVGDETNLESPDNVVDTHIGDQLNTYLPNSKDLGGDTHLNLDPDKGSGEPGGATDNIKSSLPATDIGSGIWSEECNMGSGSCAFDDSQPLIEPKVSRRYFRAEFIKSEDSLQRSLSVMLDKRITLGAFKEDLEQYVGVSANNFKVYRVFSNNQEFESIILGETASFTEDGKINIKLGRALKSGEYRVKVFQLLVNELESSKLLLDTIFARGMTVLDSKKMILAELKAQHNMDIPLDRCRLRKKTWKNPVSIYIDRQVYDDEIPIYPNWEIFLEVLENPEVMTSSSQLGIYVRRWYPSKYELGPFEEVVLQEQTVDQLREKLSELSGINTEDIDIAKGRGTFPYEVSVLEIHTELDWNPTVVSLGMWPLYICDDGCLVYYRDSKEKLAELGEEQRKEIELKENTRISRSHQKVKYSPRKEKALKIYTEDVSETTNDDNKTTNSSANDATTSNSYTPTAGVQPEMD